MKEKRMSKATVKIGMVYSAKVGEAVLPVRIDKSLPGGRYQGMDMHGGKKVTVAAAAIRGDGRTPKQWHLTRQKAEQNAAEVAAKVATKVLGVPVAAAPPRKAATKAAAKDGKKRPSGLDAAAQVLAEAGEPLNTAEMVKRMLAKGLWKTSGKTPAATIYAAVIREIAAKGKDARFRKTARGKFELAK
jgi:hypothetical protein